MKLDPDARYVETHEWVRKEGRRSHHLRHHRPRPRGAIGRGLRGVSGARQHPHQGDLIICGITDHAQEELSDVVYVEFPEVGNILTKDEVFGVVESVKAASDLYMPMGGEIVEVNAALDDSPEIVNEDPYGEGWMIKFKPSDPGEWDDLLTPEAYETSVAGE